MKRPPVTRETVLEFLAQLDAQFARPGKMYLVGESTHVYEGWRSWTTQIEYSATVAPGDAARFRQSAEDVSRRMNVIVIDESPADVIPLPAGYERRCRRVQDRVRVGNHLTLYHFDPYSVAFRFIARGDEPDYHIPLMLLKQRWITMTAMDRMLETLLPCMTMETIRQDPAEFRRKYKGLTQMWRAVTPGTTHRITAV